MEKKHRLSFIQKKERSIIKRSLVSFVNKSDSYIIQHLPEFIDEDINFSELRKFWIYKNKKNNDVDLVRLLFLICSVKEILSSGIEGSFVELGVYKGNSAKILKDLAPERKLHLFDTFEGFSEKDLNVESKEIHKDHFKDSLLDEVKSFFKNDKKVYFYPGYFPDTANAFDKTEVISLLHLDADLYKPTKSALEFFYPKVQKKGFIIIHDYFSGAWPGVKKSVDEFFKDKKEGITRIPDKSGTIVIRKL
jgi:hypothetical protein